MCIGIFKNKWQSFEPTKEYLDVVRELTSITKLYQYSKDNFRYIPEKGDHWKTPVEFLNDGGGDCEDWARWYVDILVRIIGIKKARFVIHSGYNKKRWGNWIWNIKCHAICIFPFRSKLGTFSNNQFYEGIESYEDAGHFTFKDGLKYMEIRDYEGNILERKRKWIGVF